MKKIFIGRIKYPGQSRYVIFEGLISLIQSLKIGLFALLQAIGNPKAHFMKKCKILNHGRVHSPELAPRPVGMRGHPERCPLLLAASALRTKPSGKYPGACSGRMVIYFLFFVWVTILTGCNYYGPRHESIKVVFNARGIEKAFSVGDKKSDVMALSLEKIEVNNGEYNAVHFLENHVAVFFHEDKIIRIKIVFHDDNCMFVYKTNNRSIIFSNNIDYDRFVKVNKDVFYPVNSLGDGTYTNKEHTLLIDFEHGRISYVEIHGVTDYSEEIYTNGLPQ